MHARTHTHTHTHTACHMVLELAKKNAQIMEETITVSERAAAVIGTRSLYAL